MVPTTRPGHTDGWRIWPVLPDGGGRNESDVDVQRQFCQISIKSKTEFMNVTGKDVANKTAAAS
jgi:hypothetical protein